MDAIVGTYVRPDFTLVRGEGTRVWDDSGKGYLDFTAGIGVLALGHGSPLVAEAIRGTLETGLVHTSNLYRTKPGELLAEALVDAAFPGKAFFCNSGAEANEAAFKFARKWAGQGRSGIVAFHGSFHGRLFGSLAATDRPSYQAPFEPLMPGVAFADVGDLEGVSALLAGGSVAAVIIEPVQGEGGIVPVPTAFLRGLRDLCDETCTLLIFDEVQCGLGRTGALFAHEHAGVLPDILTLAKPLAGGLPMGAVVVSEGVAGTVAPGDHATTFGGGPLVASAALAVMGQLTAPGFLEGVRERAAHLRDALAGLAKASPSVVEVRGMGLMVGIVLSGEAAPAVAQARELGLLVVSAGPTVVRLLPPLNVSVEEIDEAVAILAQSIR
jgi:predicted acetylornithine/succinylornithine family transaminase